MADDIVIDPEKHKGAWLCDACNPATVNHPVSISCRKCSAPAPAKVRKAPKQSDRAQKLIAAAELCRASWASWATHPDRASENVRIQHLNMGETDMTVSVKSPGKDSILLKISFPIDDTEGFSASSAVHFKYVNQVHLALGFETHHTLADILGKLVEFYPQHALDEDDDDWGDDSGAAAGGSSAGWGDMEDDPWAAALGSQDEDVREDPDAVFAGLRTRWNAKEAQIRAEAGNQSTSILDRGELKGNNVFTSKEVSLIMQKTIIKMMKEEKQTGIRVQPVDDNIYHWRLFVGFSQTSRIGSSLAILESKGFSNAVELDIKFDMALYPFYPPSVRPVWPRLENFFMGRIICMDELMVSKWKPFAEVDDIFHSIKKLLEKFGVIDTENPINDPRSGLVLYSESEFQLWRLSMLTETAPRSNHLYKLDENGFEDLPPVQPKLGRSKSEMEDRFKNWSSSDSNSGDILQYVTAAAAARRQQQEMLEILGVVLADLSHSNISSVLKLAVEASCLVPLVIKYFSRADFLSLAKEVELYTALLSVVRGLAAHPELSPLFGRLPEHTKAQKSLQDAIAPLASSSVKAACSLTPKMQALINRVKADIQECIKNYKPGQGKTLGTAYAPPLQLASTVNHALAPTPAAAAEKSGEELAAAANALAECPLCARRFALDAIAKHASTCVGISEPDLPVCPICAEPVPLDEMQRHVNSCLDGGAGVGKRASGTVEADSALAAAIADEDEDEDEEETPAPSKARRAKAPKKSKISSRSTVVTPSGVVPAGLEAIAQLGVTKVPVPAGHSQITRHYNAQCSLCTYYFSPAELPNHQCICWNCSVCGRSILRTKMATHVPECIERGKQDEHEEASIKFVRQEQGLLNPVQLAAVQWVSEQARIASEAKYSEVLKRFRGLGLTEDDLKCVTRFVRNVAPIVIHVHLDRYIDKFLASTTYKNQFETATSSGCLSRQTREGWENRMFNSIYDKAPDSHRVKYGVLNLANDPRGVTSCYQYGNSYLLLNNNVRTRTTFADMDTGSASAKLSTCEHYCNILATYSDTELKNIHAAASGQVLMGDSTTSSAYKEIQIHGEVNFARDIKALVANSMYKNGPQLKTIEEFCKKNSIALVWMPP